MKLADVQTPDGFITIAPFDHRTSLAKSLSLDLHQEEDKKKFIELKALFMQILSPHVSAVLTDPEFGIETERYKDSDCGLFYSLEQSGYGDEGPEAMTELLPDWGIDGIIAHHAGAKLLVNYHPEEKNAAKKRALIATLYKEAQAKGTVFLVEPVLYDLSDSMKIEFMSEEWISLHLQVCRDIAPYCDILKVQYPGSMQASQAVSAMHPHWILLSRGAPYAEFTEYMKTAVRAGCSGYAAGRAVWQEIEQYSSVDEWKAFLQETTVSRLHELTKILSTARLLS